MALIYSDIPELEGTNTEIVLSNLVSLEEDLERTVEKRLAHLSELSRSIINDGGDEDVIESIILSIKSDGYPDGEIDSAESISVKATKIINIVGTTVNTTNKTMAGASKVTWNLPSNSDFKSSIKLEGFLPFFTSCSALYALAMFKL